MDKNPSAFPLSQPDNTWPPQCGMTLRDYFAACALLAIVQINGGDDGALDTIPESAYQFADAMLAERLKGESK